MRLPLGAARDVSNETDGGSPIRLITTILDPEMAAAGELAAVYHQRWEFESSLAEIETRQRGSYRVLRSQSPEMVRQEIWALLLTHYAIRALMYEATDPDRLDIGRGTVPRHLAFGQGAHFCFRAPLARLEAQTALRLLARRFPGLRRDRSVPLRWRKQLTLRGLEALPVLS